MRISTYLLTASMLVLSAAAASADDLPLRDLTVEQSATAQLVGPHAGSLRTTVSADHPDDTYAVGESVRLLVNTNEDAYVTVLDIGPSGLATQLFPNRFQPDNHVFANRPVEIAGAGTGARIVVAPPTGTELIKVISSNRPIAVVPEAQLQGNGPFRTVDGGVRALTRDLQVVADAPAPSDTKIAFNNFALYTVPGRAPVAPQTLVVVPAAPPVIPMAPPGPPMAHVAIPADLAFPLLLAADKPGFRIGERAILAVTPLQACNLTVLEFTTTGQVHTLFPNASTPNPAVAPLQTVFVAGGPSANALVFAGPPGTEQILAICASSDAPPPPPPVQGADPSSVSRDLAVVAAHPGTAMASILLNVQP